MSERLICVIWWLVLLFWLLRWFFHYSRIASQQEVVYMLFLSIMNLKVVKKPSQLQFRRSKDTFVSCYYMPSSKIVFGLLGFKHKTSPSKGSNFQSHENDSSNQKFKLIVVGPILSLLLNYSQKWEISRCFPESNWYKFECQSIKICCEGCFQAH